MCAKSGRVSRLHMGTYMDTMKFALPVMIAPSTWHTAAVALAAIGAYLSSEPLRERFYLVAGAQRLEVTRGEFRAKADAYRTVAVRRGDRPRTMTHYGYLSREALERG